jgi:hypothetical protein
MSANGDLQRYLVETVRFKQSLGLHLPPGFHYLGGEDYVLDRGSPYESAPLTPAETKAVLRAVRSCPERRFQLGHCYHNAQLLATFDPAGLLTYCEGWATGVCGLPTLHAWVELHGKVVDMTWQTTSPNHKGGWRTRIFGAIPEDWAYYGVSFDTESIKARMLRIKATGPLLDDVAYGFPLFQEPRLRPVQELLRRGPT